MGKKRSPRQGFGRRHHRGGNKKFRKQSPKGPRSAVMRR